MQGSFSLPSSQQAGVLRLAEELDLVELEPCDDRVPNAVYYFLHEKEFAGDEVSRPLLERLAELTARERESWQAGEAQRRLLGLDIGANVGVTLGTVRDCCGGEAAKRTVPVHVIAFEPNPSNLPMLESSVQLLTMDNRTSVTVCRTVASDTAGPVRFYVNRKHNFAGNQHGSVHRFEGEYDNEDRDVKGGNPGDFLDLDADTVDHLLWGSSSADAQAAKPGCAGKGRVGSRRQSGVALRAGFDRGSVVDFVKIDTEGHEMAVLRGMTETLRQTRFVYFECSHLLQRVGVNVREIVDWLEDAGFHTYRVGKKAVLRISGPFYHPLYDTKVFWSNCLAIRKDEPLTVELLRPFALKAAVQRWT